ncbi:MAG TPA: winged helix-turn-helix domain-containing protein [Bryobacteraceae bacterium]
MSGTIFKFGEFTLDCNRFELRLAGRILKLEKKPMELLILLTTHNGELVTRVEIAERLWKREVFVDSEHGINTAVRKVRQVLRDDPEKPRFVQTVTGKGYRFIADIVLPLNGKGAYVQTGGAAGAEPIVIEPAAGSANQNGPATAQPVAQPPGRRSAWLITANVCTILAIAGAALYFSFRARRSEAKYTQLTDFTDSATAPTLSPSGRMVAFFRGSDSFGTADQVYVKVLPNGEPKRLTADPRFKYSLSFSPDGSQIAYTVLAHAGFATYMVSILGGDSHLFLHNAAGLSWLGEHQVLFSAIRSGMHMGVVTGTDTRENLRELYFPVHERGMAHYSFASPDRKLALVVEMNGEDGSWAPCRLISPDGRSQTRTIGPNGACTSAGWSPDGSWMYFTATVEGQSHLWRQRFPDEEPQQITFGPTEEDDVAVERDGRSIITSMGEHESAIWIHGPNGDRCLSSEGEIVGFPPPTFSADGNTLYYLLRGLPVDSGPELWRTTISSGKSEAVFPGISMLAFDVSPDKQAVYSTAAPGGKSELWLAPLDRTRPAKRIGDSGETSPRFGPHGQILFLRTEGNANYLERMNPDGSARSKVVPYPIGDFQGISPGGRWVMAIAPLPDGSGVAPIAIPMEGGPPRRMYAGYTWPVWSTNGRWLFLMVEAPTRSSAGRSLAIPVGPGERLPSFPAGGIAPQADASVVPGAKSIGRAGIVPGEDPTHYAYVNTTVHRNLYRISLP